MSTSIAEAILGKRNMAPEIAAAIAAVSLPEVQDMIRRLSRFNLAVCVPHMHLPEQDFAVLQSGYVQIEKQCQVSWALRDQVEADSKMIPVAWRWEDDGVEASARCSSFCVPVENSHAKYHSSIPDPTPEPTRPPSED